MKSYDFQKVIDRRGTDCVKWDGLNEFFQRDDLRSMWVADMDLRTPDFIIDSLRKRLDHPVLGYGITPKSWQRACLDWVGRRHGVQATEEDLMFIPGIVRGIAFAIGALTKENDRILVMEPVYHPFFLVPQRNHRTVVFHHLVIDEERLKIDFDQLDKDLEGCKMMILCNPHNPGGRVWSLEELQTIAALAQKHGVIVLSDEIHSDLTFPEKKHRSYSTVSQAARNHSITMSSPSKTFNMPGLFSSMALVFNPDIREQFRNYLEASELDMGNILAYTATTAAFSPEGEAWLKQMLEHLNHNVDVAERFLVERLPMVGMMRPEASFLVFLDFRRLGLDQKALNELIRDKAHLALNDGEMFGPGGHGFMRMNIAVPTSELLKGLEQLECAIR